MTVPSSARPQPRPRSQPPAARPAFPTVPGLLHHLDRLQDALPLGAADRAEAALAALAVRPDPAALRRDFGAAADEVLWAQRLFGRPAQPRPAPAFRRSLEAQLLAAQAAALAGAPAAGPCSAGGPAHLRPSLSPMPALSVAPHSRALRPLVLGLGSLCLAAFLLAQPASLPSGLKPPPTSLAATLPAAAGPTGTDTPRARATATSQQVGQVEGTAAAGG